MAEPTVTFYFFWEQASADPRQYGQQRTLLRPTTSDNEFAKVAVLVPLKHEYIFNTENIIQAQLKSDKEPLPILTPAGMVFCDEALTSEYWKLEHEEPEQEDEDNEVFSSTDWDKMTSTDDDEEDLEDVIEFDFDE